MEAQLLARALSRCTLSPSTAIVRRPTLSFPGRSRPGPLAAPRRHKATTARTKRALNVPPHPSFLAAAGPDRIVFNPPASAASVYHTPFKFLPPSDPRRRANLNALFSASTAPGAPAPAPAAASGAGAAAATSPALPPVIMHGAVSHDVVSKRHLRQPDVEEIRRLRGSDPVKWSVVKLANRFDCAPSFIMHAVQADPEHYAAMRAKLAAAKSRWGPRRTKARVDRRKRKEMIWNGEF